LAAHPVVDHPWGFPPKTLKVRTDNVPVTFLKKSQGRRGTHGKAKLRKHRNGTTVAFADNCLGKSNDYQGPASQVEEYRMSLRGPSSASTPNGSPSDDSDNPFSNLGLSSDQSAKIQLIVRNEKRQNLSAHELKRQIDAVLTPQQQSQLQTLLRSRQQRDQTVNSAIHDPTKTSVGPPGKPAAARSFDTHA
jgi:hypothetical protein